MERDNIDQIRNGTDFLPSENSHITEINSRLATIDAAMKDIKKTTNRLNILLNILDDNPIVRRFLSNGKR